MYNWRLRKEGDESDAAFAARIFNNNIRSIESYLGRNLPNGVSLFYGYGIIASPSNLTGVIYCHSELGDDSYAESDKGSAKHPYKTFAAITADGVTNKVIVCTGRFANIATGNVIVADTYGSAYFEAFNNSAVMTISGCYVDISGDMRGLFINCVVQANGHGFTDKTCCVIGCTLINAVIATSASYGSACSVYLNCKGQRSASYGYEYSDVYINSKVHVCRNSTGTQVDENTAYYYNSEITADEGTESKPVITINLSETYQSANDCFVDPMHLNFSVRRSEVRAGAPFEGWVGFTGDSVDFVKVTGDNIQEDSGSYTIDQQTPGSGRLLGAIVDNRGQFNNVFTGFNNVVFHYNSNNISIGPFEKFGTPIEVSAGASETLTVADGGMFCVSKDCEIDGTAVVRYQNIWLEAGTYTINSTNGVKFFPYNYESINNFVGCRFANLGKCTTYEAGRTLKANCSYLNQGSTDVTVSDGTVVAPGKTYVTPDQSEYTADGALLLVFDDVVNNFVWFNTNSFQTKYKAGYVVVNTKTGENLLTYDGKTIPCTEAYGEYNDIRYLASQNMQYDFFQVVVDYKVYPF